MVFDNQEPKCKIFIIIQESGRILLTLLHKNNTITEDQKPAYFMKDLLRRFYLLLGNVSHCFHTHVQLLSCVWLTRVMFGLILLAS